MKNLILTLSLILGLATSANALVASKRDGFSRECKELVIKVDLMVVKEVRWVCTIILRQNCAWLNK